MGEPTLVVVFLTLAHLCKCCYVKNVMDAHKPTCSAEDHGRETRLQVPDATLERCARIFRALGDTARMRLVARLMQGPACVSELAHLEAETVATISQRLRVLRADNIVARRRDGKHLLYSLADQHMLQLIFNGLAHASEHGHGAASSALQTSFDSLQGQVMNTGHTIHENHPHQHGANCGHTPVEHDGHTDYLHNGHLHHPHDGHVDEHTLEVSATNPADCTNGHPCDGQDAAHTHGPDCGHEAVPHGDHVDYLVKGHLHHQHNGHCDNHGPVQVVN